MRRNLKGRKPRKKKSKKYRYIRFFLIFSIIVFILLYAVRSLERYVMPTVLTMAEYRASTIASRAISQAVKKGISKQKMESKDLVSYEYNQQQEVIAYSIDTMKIYLLSSDVIDYLAEELDTIGETVISVPIGNIMKSQIFSNLGPAIPLEVIPIGTATIEYGTEFKTTGINQVNHRIWLDVHTQLQIVSPLDQNIIKVTQQFTLVERVMSGTVPPHYIHIPNQESLEFRYPYLDTK